jgi:hypothetical protein
MDFAAQYNAVFLEISEPSRISKQSLMRLLYHLTLCHYVQCIL